jgi:hypothetical protein
LSELDVRTQSFESPPTKARTNSLHPRSHKDGEPEVIDLEFGVERAVSDLRRSLGMVVTIEMREGDALCGVLGAVTADVLILEHWDESTHAPDGDPFTVSIDQMRRILVSYGVFR